MPIYDADAEQAVLGSCLIDDEVIDILNINPADFFAEQNQYVFTAMKTLTEKRKALDQITVAEELVRMGKLVEAGGVAYLSELVQIVPTSLHAEYYSEIVKRFAFNRRVISAAGQIEAIGYQNNEPAETVETIHGITKKLALMVEDNTLQNPNSIANDLFGYYSDTTVSKIIPCGIGNIDARIGGYLPGEYVLWAARTTVGKTTLLTQQAASTAETIPTLFISLEQSKQQINDKNVARITGLDQQLIALKKYNELQKNQILKAVEEISKLKLYIAEGNRTTDSIHQLVARGIDAYGIGIVFIDYLTRIKGGHGKDEHIRVSLISKDLADMAKEFMIPFVVAHQLNRGIDLRPEEKRIPTLADLREGGEEDADLILSPVRVKESTQVDIYCLKDRLRNLAGKVFETHFAHGKYL